VHERGHWATASQVVLKRNLSVRQPASIGSPSNPQSHASPLQVQAEYRWSGSGAAALIHDARKVIEKQTQSEQPHTRHHYSDPPQ
jgi:hypothetical protein